MEYLIDADSLMFVTQNTLEQAIDTIEYKLNKISFDNIVLVFSNKSFRHVIYPQYKANRKGRELPPYFNQIKEYLKNNYIYIEEEGMEADDILVSKYLSDPYAYTMCSIDKDVIKTVVGTHYNLYNQQYITITQEQADLYLATQLLIGDKIDNIPSIKKGFGEKSAHKAFKNNDEYNPLTIAIHLLKQHNIDVHIQYQLVAVGRVQDYNLFMEKYDNPKLKKLRKHPKLVKIKNTEGADYKLTFGKFKGKTLIEIKEKYNNYYNWLKEKVLDNPILISEINKLDTQQ